ncbi:hypothetical protein GCM10025865_13530 [Paraoerskovia sediminicola]|uniref:Uncharacterized protein n=1 Tax=Paraoerskovia sediminicola TaxID=1138587 RepID=A0ABM8G1Q8_9CELL|nr:hypothetical protein [Paraoerskovia sediminicola]BDZ42054.1 hypothetical protein GCM10025865_13530 [Paraoerskovia sediminicola]
MPDEVPADLADLTRRTLARDSTDGPRTPAALVAALEPWEPVGSTSRPAPAPSATSPVRQSVKDRSIAPRGTGAAGATAAGAGAGVAATAAMPPTVRPGTPAPAPAASPRPADSGSAAAAASGGGRFDPTWITLVIVAITVVLGLMWALSTAFSGFVPPVQSDGGEAARAEQPAAPEADAQTEEPAPEPEPVETKTPEPVRPVIESAEALDPEGEASGDTVGEHPEAVQYAYDGQPETFWYTRTYARPTYGMKTGVGFLIKLEEKAPVSTIVLDTNNDGGTVEVRAGSDPTEGKPLASGSFAPSTELEFDTTESDEFVLWFPELPSTFNGKNRVELNEILVS